MGKLLTFLLILTYTLEQQPKLKDSVFYKVNEIPTDYEITSRILDTKPKVPKLTHRPPVFVNGISNRLEL